MLISASYLVEEPEVVHSLLASLGEALTVTFVIAVIVEPYMRRTFLSEVGGDTIWQILNPHSPPDYRTAMVKLLGHEQYYSSREWTLNFDWEDESKGVLRIDATVFTFARNCSEKSFPLDRPMWILDSCEGYTSSYLNFCINISDIRKREQRTSDQIRGVTTVNDDGSSHVDVSALVGGLTIPSHTDYTIESTAVMYRHSNGYLPIVQSLPTLRQEFKITGRAADSLEIRLLAPKVPSVQETLRPRDGGERQIKLDAVMSPGQVMLFSWKQHVEPDENST